MSLFKLLPSPAWSHQTYLDSWIKHFSFLCNIVLYSTGLYLHTRHIHSWVLYLLWPSLLVPSEAISPLFPSSILVTYRLKLFISQGHIFLPFHTVHGVLEARILKWLAILFSSRPHFVRSLHHDTSVWVALHSMAYALSYTRLIHVFILVSFPWLWFSFWRRWNCSSASVYSLMEMLSSKYWHFMGRFLYHDRNQEYNLLSQLLQP